MWCPPRGVQRRLSLIMTQYARIQVSHETLVMDSSGLYPSPSQPFSHHLPSTTCSATRRSDTVWRTGLDPKNQRLSSSLLVTPFHQDHQVFELPRKFADDLKAKYSVVCRSPGMSGNVQKMARDHCQNDPPGALQSLWKFWPPPPSP